MLKKNLPNYHFQSGRQPDKIGNNSKTQKQETKKEVRFSIRMARLGVGTLLLAALTLLVSVKIGRTDGEDCSSFVTESVLNVADTASCELTSDLNVEEVNIDGEVYVTSAAARLFTITCATFNIEAGGKLILDGSGYASGQGPGVGTASGSGGMYFKQTIIHILYSEEKV